MPKTNTCNSKLADFTNPTFELVKWPVNPAPSLDDKVIAVQTTRLPCQLTAQASSKLALSKIPLDEQFSSSSSLTDKEITSEKSPYSYFNLGLHVGDNAERVVSNRNELKLFINQQLLANNNCNDVIKIQWLEQVHGSAVATVSVVNEQAIIADASITRDKNVALAIMTADCLPILLSHKNGKEIAAIHGGWRPLAGNIIAKTIAKMHSKPVDIVAWLGPCIGKSAFEVGSEVKQAFTQLDSTFNEAFLKQKNGKYLADLQLIARLQLMSVGVTVISTLVECTYQQTDKYYSYRKEQITGRMASIICRR